MKKLRENYYGLRPTAHLMACSQRSKDIYWINILEIPDSMWTVRTISLYDPIIWQSSIQRYNRKVSSI